jgi:hypothetical protein
LCFYFNCFLVNISQDMHHSNMQNDYSKTENVIFLHILSFHVTTMKHWLITFDLTSIFKNAVTETQSVFTAMIFSAMMLSLILLCSLLHDVEILTEYVLFFWLCHKEYANVVRIIYRLCAITSIVIFLNSDNMLHLTLFLNKRKWNQLHINVILSS